MVEGETSLPQLVLWRMTHSLDSSAMCQCTQMGTAHTHKHTTQHVKRPHTKLHPEFQTSDSPAVVFRVQLIKEKALWMPFSGDHEHP